VDAARVAQRLDEERAELSRRVAALTRDLDEVAAAAAGSNLDDEHDPEGATVAFEREQLAAVRDQAQQGLADVAAAQERLVAGSYGRCERCGEPIADERLDALPATRWCVRCAARR
jgi:RNA polymerase-binding transcription factor DksA